MNTAEYVAASVELGLSNVGMAGALGIGVRRSRDYAFGRRDVSRVISLAVWALVSRPRLDEVSGLLRRMNTGD